MPSRPRKESDLRALCAHLYPDDGIDPRADRRHKTDFDSKPDRKTWQLCKQVARTLQLALGTLPRADALAGVTVGNVTPAPHAGRLRVAILAPDPARRAHVETIINHHAAQLRAEVAAAITRRRAPELTFTVIAEGGHHD